MEQKIKRVTKHETRAYDGNYYEDINILLGAVQNAVSLGASHYSMSVSHEPNQPVFHVVSFVRGETEIERIDRDIKDAEDRISICNKLISNLKNERTKYERD